MRDTRLNLALQYQRLSSRLNADIACHKLHAKRIKATVFESLPSPQILNNNQGKPDYMTVIMAPNYNLSALQASVFFLINTESQPFLRVISTGGTGGRFGACCIVIFLSVCDCHRENKKKKRRGGGDTEVETDKNSCDRNEECSVLKGLAFTPEVCFHSLMRGQRSRCSSKQARWNCFTPLDGSLVETCRGVSAASVCRPAGGHMIWSPNQHIRFIFTSL